MKHLLRYNLRSLHNVEPEGRTKIQKCGKERQKQGEREREREREREGHKENQLGKHIDEVYLLQDLSAARQIETEIYSKY